MAGEQRRPEGYVIPADRELVRASGTGPTCWRHIVMFGGKEWTALPEDQCIGCYRAQLAQAQAESDIKDGDIGQLQICVDLLTEKVRAAEQARERAEAALRVTRERVEFVRKFAIDCRDSKPPRGPIMLAPFWVIGQMDAALAAPGKESEAQVRSIELLCKHGEQLAPEGRCLACCTPPAAPAVASPEDRMQRDVTEGPRWRLNAPSPSPAAEALTAYVPPPHTQTPEYQRDVREHFGPAAEAQGACSAECKGYCGGHCDMDGVHAKQRWCLNWGCAGREHHRPAPAAKEERRG